MLKESIKDIQVKDKRVLVRVDFNVPLDKKSNVSDDNRIKESLPTIKYLIEAGSKVILMSHLGRPKGEKKTEFSLKPIAGRLSELLGKPVKMLSDCIGEEVKQQVSTLKSGQVILLENLRFHKQEEENDSEFARELASLGEVFINDAFGVSHRAHASTEGVTHYLESAAGFLVQKEIENFEKILKQPKKPFIFILGGAKVSDKIQLIENMLKIADSILIGGAMAYSFMKVKGVEVGSSHLEEASFEIVNKIFTRAKEKGVKIVLPVDHVITDNFRKAVNIKTTESESIESDWMGVDIGPRTIELFSDIIKRAKTIVWNGPPGVFENDKFAEGSKKIAEAIANSEAISVIGGGDTAAAVAKFSLSDKMSHISTGGGASLEYLEGKVLPGIASLTDKEEKV